MNRLILQNTAENRKGGTIQVKKSYIYIPLVFRVVFAITVFSVLDLVFLILYLLLGAEFSSPFLLTLALPLSVVTAVLPSLPVAFSDRILKRLSDKWGYSRFYWVQQFALMASLLSFLGMVVFFLASQFYEPPPLWSFFLYLGLLPALTYATPFLNFFSLRGVAVLSFKVFLKEFEKKPDEANFGKLATATKKISKIAELYNMHVSPNQLALALTTSFLEDNEETRKDFDVLIEWIENSTKQENFKRFRKLVKKYDSFAQKITKEGITEKYHWTFERTVKFIEAIVIPLAVIIIVNVVPKILEMLG